MFWTREQFGIDFPSSTIPPISFDPFPSKSHIRRLQEWVLVFQKPYLPHNCDDVYCDDDYCDEDEVASEGRCDILECKSYYQLACLLWSLRVDC